jgi:hypothetical protein
MGSLIGDKLYESTHVLQKPHEVIDQLQATVEFPDVRQLVNEGKHTLDQVLMFRDKGRRFRQWLQAESNRDRDAIIAYHNEVAKESGFIRATRKTLSIFGYFGNPATGAGLGAVMTGPAGAVYGSLLGSAAGYLLDVASKYGAEWKPVVFGNWLRDRISVLLEKETSAISVR